MNEAAHNDQTIRLRGVRVHNLKSVDLDLPRGKLIAFCGVSGSGKSSIAIDTLYAEGQRRYIESFSPAARQFLERMEKPAADSISGLPPAILVARTSPAKNQRTTVGTATEILPYVRQLYAKLSVAVCPQCKLPVQAYSPQSAAEELCSHQVNTRFLVTFSIGEEETPSPEQLLQAGFIRVIAAGRTHELSEQTPLAGEVFVVVDRLSASSPASRVTESLETAFAHGEEEAVVFISTDESEDAAETIDDRPWRRKTFHRALICGGCGRSFPTPDAKLFSYNTPLGACASCAGQGEVDGKECPACQGTRLRVDARAFHISGKNIAEFSQLEVKAATAWLKELSFSEASEPIARPLLKKVLPRLDFLEMAGLGYVSLHRSLGSLSSGEAQRVALTSALGSNLVEMLYVLDEPTAGLHAADAAPMRDAILSLRNRGNTVVVVEHEETLLSAADQLVEIGPAAGENGGEVVFQGTLGEMLSPAASLTGEYLAGRRGIFDFDKRRPAQRGKIRLAGARGRNLKNLTVEFPLGLLCVVSGVSGAGKSSLVMETLYGALCKRKKKKLPPTLPYDDVFGDGQIDDIVLIDSSPIGRSPRSNPVTYIKAFDDIRNTFAETLDARTRNYTPGHFSFNVEGGRCGACQGDGSLQIDMQFLADVYVRCPQCLGKRFRPEILAVLYRGRSIADVLEMTVREAFAFFRGQTKVQSRLKRLIDVGLEYLQLGQPANTLSGGEAQRLKLAFHLTSTRRSRTLFLIDEPTTGLHFSDVVKLLDCFDSLLAVGHSLIVIEHRLQLLKSADYILDLGPGAAAAGGNLVAQGTPEEIAKVPESITGEFLAKSLAPS